MLYILIINFDFYPASVNKAYLHAHVWQHDYDNYNNYLHMANQQLTDTMYYSNNNYSYFLQLSKADLTMQACMCTELDCSLAISALFLHHFVIIKSWFYLLIEFCVRLRDQSLQSLINVTAMKMIIEESRIVDKNQHKKNRSRIYPHLCVQSPILQLLRSTHVVHTSLLIIMLNTYQNLS